MGTEERRASVLKTAEPLAAFPSPSAAPLDLGRRKRHDRGIHRHSGIQPHASRKSRHCRPVHQPFPAVAPLGRPCPRPRQSDRRTYRLQRRLRAAAGHRSGRLDRPAAARRPPRRRSIRSITTRRASSRSTTFSNEKAGWIEYLKGTAWSLQDAGHRLDRLGRRHAGRRAARRRAVVVGRARNGHRPGVGRRRQSRLESRQDGQARPAGREQMGRRQLRHHGPIDLGRRPRRTTPC